MDDGYVPLLLAGLVYGVMLVWHRGSQAVAQSLTERLIPIEEFMASIEEHKIPRVPGTAVFLTRTLRGTPPVMCWHVTHNRALHDYIFVLTALTESVPWVNDSERLALTQVAPNFWRATARCGFMERPDVPALLKRAQDPGCVLELKDVTYYVGHDFYPRDGCAPTQPNGVALAVECADGWHMKAATASYQRFHALADKCQPPEERAAGSTPDAAALCLLLL